MERTMLLPLSARNPLSCTRRTHSQPHYLRNHKVKINLKRLPTDFFHPSLPEISCLQESRPRKRAVTQDIRQIQQSSEKKSCVLARLASQQEQREGNVQYRSEKRKRIASQHSLNNQQQNQNKNLMNWTFSRRMCTRDNHQTAKSPPQIEAHLQETIASQYKSIMHEKSRSRGKNREGRTKETSARVNNILTDKLVELNINRLKMNLRKNNHPQSYLQYIKKCCI